MDDGVISWTHDSKHCNQIHGRPRLCVSKEWKFPDHVKAESRARHPCGVPYLSCLYGLRSTTRIHLVLVNALIDISSISGLSCILGKFKNNQWSQHKLPLALQSLIVPGMSS